MKKIYILLISAALIPMSLLLTAYSSDTIKTSDGIWANSGSPGDGEDCSACHSGALNTDNSWITTNIPTGGYVAGQTYTINITSTGGSSGTKKGFSIACENTSNAAIGTFVITDATNTVFFSDHVSHSAAGNSLAAWTFDWTAPITGSGDITFYSSTVFDGYGGGVVNSILSFSEQTTGIENMAIENAINIYPNPAIDYLYVDIPFMNNEMAQVSIYSINGLQVFANEVYISETSTNNAFDVSGYDSGIYIIKFSGEQGTLTKRFIVQQ